MKALRVPILILMMFSLCLTECKAFGQTPDDKTRKIAVTTVESKDVTLTHQYVCRIHAIRHIEVRTLMDGLVMTIPIKEGQAVKKGDELFKLAPVVDKPGAAGEAVSIRAPYAGLIGRLLRKEGSLVREGASLTTLSDNSVMWVYFNVPEKRYLEFMEEQRHTKESPEVELRLADHKKFPQHGKIGAIDASFNKDTGSIAFRADFPNPDGVLRHGQAGTLLMRQRLKNAIVIPQRATFEKGDKRYVFAVDKDDVAHQREIDIQNEADGLFVIQKGAEVGDKVVLEGVKLVHDGQKLPRTEAPRP
jgi:membrane fusion protein (multidrug efflux system)